MKFAQRHEERNVPSSRSKLAHEDSQTGTLKWTKTTLASEP
jgi:hypothetical protein